MLHFLAVALLLLAAREPVVASEPSQDKQALLDFIARVPHKISLHWNASVSACLWVGVQCDQDHSSVLALRLPAVGLVGPIPANTLGRLSQLRVLSLRSNLLSGEVPSDFSNLTLLRSLYLQNNRLSGEFPASIARLKRLTRLDLSSNNLSGSIPSSLNGLVHLTGLFLEINNFTGHLPDIDVRSLTGFNASYNDFNGSIPEHLSKFNASSFVGNSRLCGKPLLSCISSFPPSPSPSETPPLPTHKKSKKLSTLAIALIAAGSALAVLLLLLVAFLCLRRKRQPRDTSPKQVASSSAVPTEAGTSSVKEDVSGDAERNKLVFFGGYQSFDLEDLLRASAEVLGKGSVGTSYKAVLEEGTMVVVKRLKDVVATRKEFEIQMEVLGRIRHEYLLPLRAFYHSKDEKLLVYDFMEAGSLAALLHGNRGTGRPPLSWEDRMRIASSCARGMLHLHMEENVVHGNIKSSNTLLRPDHEAVLSDYGLNPLFSNSSPMNRIAGYRAPEIVETRKVTFKSDIYSFGVLLLELLTGKAPNQSSLTEDGIDLPRWVQSVVREEWTAEVFDAELMKYNADEEMVQLLQLALACVATVPDQRPDMPQVLKMMEEMSRSEADDGVKPSSSSHASPVGLQTTPGSATD